MKVKLDIEKISFRQGDGTLSAAQQLEIVARRIAGCQRALRPGEPLRDLERILDLRGNGAPEGLLVPWPVHPPEPYRVKSVELRGHGCPTGEVRLEAIEEAGYNTFLLKEDKRVVIHIDLLTDSGTSAMSDLQWSAMLKGNEDYAGSRSYYPLEKAVQEVYGWQEVVPTHQGRGAEHIVSTIFIKPLLEQYPGDPVYVPKNMYFTTTKAHIQRAVGVFRDIIIDQAHDATAWHPFKGNIGGRLIS